MNDSKQAQTLDRKLYLSHAKLDGQVVKELTAAGMAWLNTNKQTVNALSDEVEKSKTYLDRIRKQEAAAGLALAETAASGEVLL